MKKWSIWLQNKQNVSRTIRIAVIKNSFMGLNSGRTPFRFDFHPDP